MSFLFILTLTQCKKDKINEPSYAIGVINFYTPRHIFPNTSGAQINYTFFVNGKEYDNQYSNRQGGKEWKIPASGNYNKGDQCMVQYNKSDPDKNPQSSRMLFDYPVKDSNDYKNYVNQFKTNPPK